MYKFVYFRFFVGKVMFYICKVLEFVFMIDVIVMKISVIWWNNGFYNVIVSFCIFFSISIIFIIFILLNLVKVNFCCFIVCFVFIVWGLVIFWVFICISWFLVFNVIKIFIIWNCFKNILYWVVIIFLNRKILIFKWVI